MRILLAEDDGRLAEPLQDYLQREQHGVVWLADGRQALAALLAEDFDLALLDWMLPGLDGLSVVAELRRRGRDTLVLMLTARDDLGDVVQGLHSGADDYMVKPFRMAELSARIRSLERRSARVYQPTQLCWGTIQLDPLQGRASVGGQELALTARELQLLEWFLRHPARLVSRSLLLDHLWSLDRDASENTVKTHLNNLRRKLRSAGSDDPIETLHGMGYRLREAPV